MANVHFALRIVLVLSFIYGSCELSLHGCSSLNVKPKALSGYSIDNGRLARFQSFQLHAESEGSTSIGNSLDLTDVVNSNSKDGGIGALSAPAVPLILLNAVTVIWGTQHAMIKLIVDGTGGGDEVSPALLSFVRFSLAGLFAFPSVASLLGERMSRTNSDDSKITQIPFSSSSFLEADDVGSDEDEDGETQLLSISSNSNQSVTSTATTTTTATLTQTPPTWVPGLELGGWMFAGYALQAYALQFTSASRSAFLLYLNVKFVPLIALLLYGRRSSAVTWISALAAVCGTSLLAFDSTLPPNIGDLWSLAAAVSSAMFILSLEKYANGHNPRLMNFYSISTVTVLSLAWLLLDTYTSTSVGSAPCSTDVLTAALQQAQQQQESLPYCDGQGAAAAFGFSFSFVGQFAGVVGESFRRVTELIAAAPATSATATTATVTTATATAAAPDVATATSTATATAVASLLSDSDDSSGVSGGGAVGLNYRLPPVVYLLYLGGICTALSNWLQALGQRTVPAQSAALIYAMDPVYAAIFARWFLGEELGALGIVGGGVITLAALSTQAESWWRQKQQDERQQIGPIEEDKMEI